MSSAASDERARFQRGAVRTVPADRNCRGCGRPIQFIKHPQTGKPQACDCDERLLVTSDGNVVRGFASHWSTCTNPPERTNAPSKPVEGRVAPRKAAAEPPAPAAPQAQLALLGGADPLIAAGNALAEATTVGHWDATIRSSLIQACKHPTGDLDIRISEVSGYEDSNTRSRARWREDNERLRSLRNLTVGDQRVFLAVCDESIGRAGVDGCDQEGRHVLLRLHPAIIARFIAPALPPTVREPGEDG